MKHAETTARTHSEFSPSKWPAIIQCGFYESSSASTEASLTGSAAHAALAEILSGKNDVESLCAAREIMPEFSASELERVHIGASRILEAARGAKINLEEYITIAPGVAGYADVWWRDKAGVLNVLDYKHFRIGDKDYWPQVAGYAAGLIDGDDEIVRMFIDSADGIVQRCVSAKLCRAQWHLVRCSRFDAEHGYSKPTPNLWCKYCANAGACAEQRNAVEIAAKSSVTIGERWESLSPEEKCAAVDLAETAEKYADTVRGFARRDLESGLEITGWSIKTRKGARRVDDVRGLVDAMIASGVETDAIKGAIKISATDAAKLLTASGMQKKSADEIVDRHSSRAPDVVSLSKTGG